MKRSRSRGKAFESLPRATPLKTHNISVNQVSKQQLRHGSPSIAQDVRGEDVVPAQSKVKGEDVWHHGRQHRTCMQEGRAYSLTKRTPPQIAERSPVLPMSPSEETLRTASQTQEASINSAITYSSSISMFDACFPASAIIQSLLRVGSENLHSCKWRFQANADEMVVCSSSIRRLARIRG